LSARRTLTLAALAALALSACRKHELSILGGQRVPLGKPFEVTAARHYWSFEAKPGESYHLQADWPGGALIIQAGSAHRDDKDADDDDDDDVSRATARQVGPHRWVADWQVGPKANVAFFGVTLSGNGFEPIQLTIDRGASGGDGRGSR